MERRDFLAGGAGAAGALAGLASMGAAAQNLPAVNWRLASSFPKSLDTIYGGAEQFARVMDAATGGRFKITVTGPGEPIPPLGVFEAVQKGTVECAHTYGLYFVNINKAFAFDGAVPFGFNERQHNAWVLQGGGLELLRELFAQYNIVNFMMGNTGAQMGGWYNKEIRNLEDVKGLKIRIPGLGAEVWKRLGAEPVNLPGGEIASALRDRKVDAAEWIGPYDDEKLGLAAAARFYYYPAWWEPQATLSLYVSKTAYDALHPVYKETLAMASSWVHQWMMATYDMRNPAAYKRLIGSGTRVQLFPNNLMIAAYRASQAIMEAEATSNASFRKIYGPWKRFRGEINEWHKTAEAAMTNFLASWRVEG